jgi:hypothetical protein
MANKFKRNVYDLRTNEVQEIIGHVPHWTVKMGSGVLLLLLIVLLSCAWLIKVPEIQTLPININIGQKDTCVILTSTELTTKLRPKQVVLIKLLAYPFQQYGAIKGEIIKIEYSNTDDTASVYLRLCNLPYTSTGFVLPSGRALSGRAEVVVNEQRILSKLISTGSKN